MLPSSFAFAREQPEEAPEHERHRLQQKSISEYGQLYARDDIVDPEVRAQLYGRAVELVPSAFLDAPCACAALRTRDSAPQPKARASKPPAKNVKDAEDCIVRVILIVGTRGAWDAKEDYVVTKLFVAPSAAFVKRGSKENEGKARYIKLSDREKDFALSTYDSLISQGWGVNEARKFINELGHPFSRVCAASINTWRSKLGASTVPDSSKAGRPSVIPLEHRQAIMTEVQSMIEQSLAVTAETVATAAISYMENNNLSHLLHSRGGRFKAGKSWCNELLNDRNFLDASAPPRPANYLPTGKSRDAVSSCRYVATW